MWDHFFPLLFPKDSESLKILDIRLREVGAKRPLNGTSKVNTQTPLHVRLLVANCADERGQTDRQKNIQTDRQTDRQRDIQTDRQTDWHTDSTLSLDRTGLFHHCWASPAAVGQILSKIILSYPPGLFTERGAPHFWKDTKLSFFKAILFMVMLHKVA